MRNSKDFFAYTGGLFEREILGECIFVWDKYSSYIKCIELVKANQPRGWNPSDPPTVAANDLHALVVEALNLEDYDSVKLYTALHSPLDFYHGVDCFVEYNGRVATIDLTVNRYKDVYKANFILHEHEVYNEQGKVNQEALRLKARDIANCLRAA